MEIALHQVYKDVVAEDERNHHKLVHEYPLSGKPPMMTHIFENQSGNRIIAAKGAPEALMTISNLKETEKKQITEAIQLLAKDGFRVLAVATSDFKGTEYPEKQQDFQFSI